MQFKKFVLMKKFESFLSKKKMDFSFNAEKGFVRRTDKEG